jgi:4-hydroxyphenylpyruvate dioxygenase
LDLGAKPINIPTGPIELNLPTTKGIGGAPVYLIDRYQDGQSIHDINSEIISNAPSHPTGRNFTAIDHMTHKVFRGHIRYLMIIIKSYLAFVKLGISILEENIRD